MRSAISSLPLAQMPGNPGWPKSSAQRVAAIFGSLVLLWSSIRSGSDALQGNALDLSSAHAKGREHRAIGQRL